MRKVKAEEFQKWFENPEEALQTFMNSGQAIMTVSFEQAGGRGFVELNQRDVAHLLEEFRIIREEA